MKNILLLIISFSSLLFSGVINITDSEGSTMSIDLSEIEKITFEEKEEGNMVLVQGGSFEMGDHFEEGDSYELPIHTVTLNDFYIGKYEVTQGEYQTIMGINPAAGSGSEEGENFPVYYVSWHNSIKYCNKRSVAEGYTPCYSVAGDTDPDHWQNSFTPDVNWSADGYRLATEAEWEYAARGGVNWDDNFKYSGTTDNPDDYIWYSATSGGTLHEGGTKLGNQLGIFDMSGNLYEWCWDYFGENYYASSPAANPTGPVDGVYRVARSGYWNVTPFAIRVAFRNVYNPVWDDFILGFRVVRASL